MTDTIQNQPKTRRDAIEMDNVISQKANLKKNTDANQLLSLRKRLDVLLRTGQLLLESSADTNRIRRNMVRAALFLGFNEDNLHIFIDHNILMVNYSDEAHSFTKFQKRVKDGINFTTIEAISHLTYKAVRKHFSVEDYEAELEKIAARPRNYNQLVTSAGAALACGGFCIQFGCDWTAFLYASLAAFIGFNCRAYFNKLGVNKYFSIAIAAFVSTLVAWITTYLPAWTTTPLHPLLACALFIVPGVPLIALQQQHISLHLAPQGGVGQHQGGDALDLVGALLVVDHVLAAGAEDGGDHLHGGGFAVAAGDGDDVLRQLHPGQNVRADLQGELAGHGAALAHQLAHKAAQLADHDC